MSRDPLLYLQEIIDAIAYIRSFTEGMSQDAFLADRKTQHACIRDLEVLGEAAKYLPDSLKQREGSVEWRKIAGLRDVLIHQYFGVDLDIVWDVISNKLDGLDLAARRLRDHVKRGG